MTLSLASLRVLSTLSIVLFLFILDFHFHRLFNPFIFITLNILFYLVVLLVLRYLQYLQGPIFSIIISGQSEPHVLLFTSTFERSHEMGLGYRLKITLFIRHYIGLLFEVF